MLALCPLLIVSTACGSMSDTLLEADSDTAGDRPGPDHPPTGHVERTDRTVVAVPDSWAGVRPLLETAVSEAELTGYSMSACVRALDSTDEPVVCAGDDEPRYAASVIKIAYAVAALEAWDADTDADTPFGPLGRLLDLAVSASDNDAANNLYDLTVLGPRGDGTNDPIEQINTVSARVGLAESFHTGGDFRGLDTGDWSRVTARGSVDYLAELVRAADGRTTGDKALTTPKVARAVLAAMATQERTWKLPAHLPTGTVANKTGETDDESHDIAVINTTSGRFAVAVIATADQWSGAPDEITADLGRDLVDLLGAPAQF